MLVVGCSSSVDSVSAAAGIKIAAPNLEDALAGAPLFVVPTSDQLDDYVKLVSDEVQQIKIDTDICLSIIFHSPIFEFICQINLISP